MTLVYVLVVVTICMIAVQSTTSRDIIVGGDRGWTTRFNYEAWAASQNFHVGDTLVFRYERGVHNVFKVDGSTFQQCVPPPPGEALTSGNDKIALDTPGRKWFICGIGKHCEDENTKLDITVFPQLWAPSPSSWPPQDGGFSGSSAKRNLPLGYRVLACGVISFVLMHFR